MVVVAIGAVAVVVAAAAAVFSGLSGQNFEM